jgi:hypothetical protein
MPWGSWINDLPTEFFLVVHIAAFALGAGFAWLAFKRELALLGSAFSLFAAAELVYMTYHLDWTVFLFAHTIAEVLDLTAFVLVFAAAVYAAVRRPSFGVSRSCPEGSSSRPSQCSPRSCSRRAAAAQGRAASRWRRPR